ncbi:MAG: SulP family inorganic anion transporter [Terracidiphilus sp.]|jgi:MFS superfamily sulfate permease-like transporter
MLRAKTKYSWERFGGDCAGGFIAALIALPYGLSMATLMGLPPILGVFTSVISTPFVVLLGRNSLLMGGTASATVPFISSAVRAQGIAGAAKISIVASVFMMCFCIMRLGRQVSRVPIAVVAGFSAGIGALMVISQLPIMLGVHQTASEIPVVELAASLSQITQAHWLPFVLSCTVIAAAFICTRISHRIPAPLIGVIVSFLVALLLHSHEPEVGSLQLAMPQFAGFSWTSHDVVNLLPSGLMLAFVSSVNLLLTSRTIEHFQGRHKPLLRADSDAEVGAYGIANLAVGIFGAPMSVGIPARSVAAIRCGATTRFANVIHAVLLLVFVRYGSSVLAHIPMAALAGVTTYMGISLLDIGTWRRLRQMHFIDAASFLITVVGVLVSNAVTAVIAGAGIYVLRYVYKRYLHPMSFEAGAADRAA